MCVCVLNGSGDVVHPDTLEGGRSKPRGAVSGGLVVPPRI